MSSQTNSSPDRELPKNMTYVAHILVEMKWMKWGTDRNFIGDLWYFIWEFMSIYLDDELDKMVNIPNYLQHIKHQWLTENSVWERAFSNMSIHAIKKHKVRWDR